MSYRKSPLFISCAAFLIGSFLQAGFIEGTLVKTLQGFVPIQELQINDKVYAYDTQTNECILRSIVAVSTHDVPSIVWIKANDKYIFTDPKQPFYVATEKKWCKAIDLKPNMVLQAYHGQNILVEKVTELPFCTKVHDLTLNTPHSFCVTSDGIVVHNLGFVIPIAYFGAQGITLASGIGYSALCAIGALLFYKAIADNMGASIDPNLTVSNTQFLNLQEPTFNEIGNHTTQTPQFYVTPSHDSSYSSAHSTLYHSQKTFDNFGSSSFEKYHGVHDTQSFPIPKLPSTNACLAPDKNNNLPEIFTCPPPQKKEEQLPTIGCGLSLSPTTEPLPGGCLPEPAESDIIRCPGIVGAWEPEGVKTTCNWGKNPSIPAGLLEMYPENTDQDNPENNGNDTPTGEDKDKGQSTEVTPEKKRQKNNKPQKEIDRPWDLPERDPAIDIEKIDFSLTPHLTDEEIELIKECIRRFLGVEGLLAKDCPLWRILKYEKQKNGALFELEFMIELSNQGRKIIKMGNEIEVIVETEKKIVKRLVEIDIETDTELIECKSGGWEMKDVIKIEKLKDKLLLGDKYGNSVQKPFVVVSKKQIPTTWKNWLNENNIKYREKIHE